jgi:hypothetical protein
MLASLLPGLRELRTPLAVGYMWLLNLWLVLHDVVPTKSTQGSSDTTKAVFQLGGIVGATASLAVLTFVAYVLGSMLTVTLGWNVLLMQPEDMMRSLAFGDYLRKLHRRERLQRGLQAVFIRPFLPDCELLDNQLIGFVGRSLNRISGPVSEEIEQRSIRMALLEQQRDALNERIGQAPSVEQEALYEQQLLDVLSEQRALSAQRQAFYEQPGLSEKVALSSFVGDNIPSVPEEYQFVISNQLPTVGIQLQAVNRDLWDTFDRARAESEFRSAIAWPLFVLVLILGSQLSPWWLFLLFIPIVLLVLGMGKAFEATSTLVQALELDLVKPPIFVRLEEEVDKLPAHFARGAITTRVHAPATTETP